MLTVFMCNFGYGQIDTIIDSTVTYYVYEELFYVEPPQHKLDSFCICEFKTIEELLLMKSYIEENMVLECNDFKKIMYQTCLLNISFSIGEIRSRQWIMEKQKLRFSEDP
jgi:hypothetical protein